MRALPPAFAKLPREDAGSAFVTNGRSADAQLIDDLLRGDPRAGGLLYDRLIRVVEWTLYRVMGRGQTDHDDLVQAAFEQIVTTLYEQRFARSCSLTSWASAITCRVALNELRARRRRGGALSQASQSQVDGLPSNGPDVEASAAARQLLERVRDELAQMNAEQAQVLVLFEVNGLDLAEIAQSLSISITAAQSRLSRGRRELARRLDSEKGDGTWTRQ